jgi:hypothetical protein
MSFNKKYLPEVEKLVKIRESYSSDKEFLEDYFRKVDAVFGSSESFDYINQLKKRVEEDEQEVGKGS